MLVPNLRLFAWSRLVSSGQVCDSVTVSHTPTRCRLGLHRWKTDYQCHSWGAYKQCVACDRRVPRQRGQPTG
jgi:hypothetical protein